jgi:hypothetical protein
LWKVFREDEIVLFLNREREGRGRRKTAGVLFYLFNYFQYLPNDASVKADVIKINNFDLR